jgi:hypothetical protein
LKVLDGILAKKYIEMIKIHLLVFKSTLGKIKPKFSEKVKLI